MKNYRIATLTVLFSFGLFGCAGGDSPKPTQEIEPDVDYVFTPDAGPGPDTADAGDDDASNADVGPDADEPVDPPELEPLEVVEESGTEAVILRGILLTPEGATLGEVFFDGPIIQCVDTSCASAPGAENATVVETNGLISPGLVDAHNHIPYNFLPRWDGGQFFQNRYEWSDVESYENHVEPYAANRSSGSHYCPAAKWGEFRSLINGTTTVMGQSFNQLCVGGWVRNADHRHDLQHNHMRTTIGSPRDITDDQAQNYIDSFDEVVNPTTRFAVHMAEGLTGNNVELEFASFAGRDDRSNRHQGVSLLYKETAVLIHSVAVTDAELDEVAQTNSKIVWSPSSNFDLYGETTDIVGIVERDIVVGLGPDWTVSGEENMLGEMRYALDYVKQTGIDDVVTPKVIWDMATHQGAEVVGLEEYIGVLEVGMRADITVFSPLDEDPFESVALNRAEHVRLVVIDGEVYFGDVEARAALARNPGCEAVDVCGASKFLCVQDSDVSEGRRTLAEVEQQLVDILEGTGYPEDEQYGRGDELLPLWSCL